MNNIIAHTTYNPKIDVAEVQGDLTDNAVLDLQKYLYNCLEFDRRYQIMNLKHTQKIDNLAINILEDFGCQGIRICLINAGPEIIRMLNAAKRGSIVEKIYDVTDNDKAVSLVEKDFSLSNRDTTDKRRYPRVPTLFPCSFSIIDSKHHMMDEFGNGRQPCQNETIIVTAKTINLSEGGIFADHIIAFNPETEKEIDRPEIIGNKIYNLKFCLNGNSKLVETRGEYVRQQRDRGRLSAAIRFKGISNDMKEMIRENVDSQLFDNIKMGI
ncbi:MAG: PilZ domain-containing protein [Candidatus Anammoxibacter sp.]